MKKQVLLWGVIFSLILTGCTKEKQMDKLLTKIQHIEEEMHEVQKDIYHLDEKEAVIFEEMTSVGNDTQKVTEQLVDDALHILEDKKQKMDLVTDLFKTSQEQLANLEEIASQDKNNSNIRRLINILQKRYTYYEDLYDRQSISIDLHQDLYGAFLEEVNVSEMKKMLQVINDNGKLIEKHHDHVNELTEEFNYLINNSK